MVTRGGGGGGGEHTPVIGPIRGCPAGQNTVTEKNLDTLGTN